MRYPAPEGAALIMALGAGSMFEVALVLHDGARVVCKRLRARMRHELAARDALWRERDVLRAVRHRALPVILGEGEDGHGPFLLESVIEGEPISSLVERGTPPSDMLAAVLRAAFAALGEVHALGLVLGDIGPDHVLVGTRRGDIGFVDFGQASWPDHPPRADERGTLPYAAPEVSRGEALLSHSSDVYALAATFAFAALGREPCAESGPARLVEISERGLDLGALQASTALPREDLAVLSHALQLDPSARLTRASDVLAELAPAT